MKRAPVYIMSPCRIRRGEPGYISTSLSAAVLIVQQQQCTRRGNSSVRVSVLRTLNQFGITVGGVGAPYRYVLSSYHPIRTCHSWKVSLRSRTICRAHLRRERRAVYWGSRRTGSWYALLLPLLLFTLCLRVLTSTVQVCTLFTW